MRIKSIAVAAGLGLAACAGQAGTDGGDAKPVADERFDYAANFTCEGGSKLDVVFHQGDGETLARVDGGAAMSLKVDEAATTGMTWKNDTASLMLDGPGATWTSDGASRACTFEPRSLPPPKMDGVARTLTSEDAGKSFDVKVGDKIAVALSGVPTAGYVWGASAPPAWVKATDGPGGATTSSQFLPGFAGGNHWEVVVFEAVAAGEGEITLAQRRPWESAAEPDASTFKFMLKAS
jgi:predicted secreted protein